MYMYLSTVHVHVHVQYIIPMSSYAAKASHIPSCTCMYKYIVYTLILYKCPVLEAKMGPYLVLAGSSVPGSDGASRHSIVHGIQSSHMTLPITTCTQHMSAYIHITYSTQYMYTVHVHNVHVQCTYTPAISVYMYMYM